MRRGKAGADARQALFRVKSSSQTCFMRERLICTNEKLTRCAVCGVPRRVARASGPGLRRSTGAPAVSGRWARET